jgi:hypothetical protein
MSTSNQPIIIFCSAITLLLVTAFILPSVTSKKNNLLHREGYAGLQKEASGILPLKASTLENWVFDNSYWNELVTAYAENDNYRVSANTVSRIKKYNTDYLGLINKKGNPFYSSAGTGEKAAAGNLLPCSQALPGPVKKLFTLFYITIKINTPVKNGFQQV